jgi:succinate dehydrogenase / fumarate reductase cytochrome b subunit
MWLSNSSVGRKFVMALTGACLVLFVTFHCLMNAVAICWPTAYNAVCEFLGANWYALIASAGLAVLFIVHIIYAAWLTIQNRKARGTERYAVSKRPAGVEWSSKNMFVLGVVIVAFFIVHLIQFWAKMQLVEVLGCESAIPAAAGTLFIQEAFSQPWTIVVYLIGFVALWFHLTHGFWSMFQTVGWDSTVWIPRLKKIGCWWTSIVVVCFMVQAVVFTVRANEGYYKSNEDLRAQYKEMLVPMFEKSFPGSGQVIENTPFEQLGGMFDQQLGRMQMQYDEIKDVKSREEAIKRYGNTPEVRQQIEEAAEKIPAMIKTLQSASDFVKYINSEDDAVEVEPNQNVNQH